MRKAAIAATLASWLVGCFSEPDGDGGQDAATSATMAATDAGPGPSATGASTSGDATIGDGTVGDDADSGSVDSTGEPPPGAVRKSQTITVVGPDILGVLPGGVVFPLLLASERGFEPEGAAPGGDDLRVFDAAGVLLPHEVEVWEPDALSVVWVRASILDEAHDHVVVEYGPPAPGQMLPPPKPTAEVWLDFDAVWHMDTSRAATFADHAGAHDLSVAAGMVFHTAAGAVGPGADFGSTAHATAAGPDGLEGSAAGFSLEAWVRIEGRIAQTRQVLALFSGGMPIYRFVASCESCADVGESDVALLRVRLADESTLAVGLDAPLGPQWHHLAAIHDAVGDVLRLCLDGQCTHEAPLDGASLAMGGDELRVAEGLTGGIDEVRIRRTWTLPEAVDIGYRLVAQHDDVFEYGPAVARP